MQQIRQLTILAVVLMGLTLSGGEWAAQEQQTVPWEQIDTYFSQLVAAQGFSGAVLVAKSGEVVLHQGYGLARDTGKTPVTANTVFDIGSISKQFTAAAILHLEMQGLLSVDDPITNFFANVPPDKAGITVHHLLTHSAGFTQDHFEGDLTPLTKEEALRAILAQKLGFEPGTEYSYSNASYTLLAMVIEEVSGRPYTFYLRDSFFEPLGMSATGFYGEPHWASLPVANTYFNGEDQGQPDKWPGPYWGVMGNGGIMSTVSDLYTWWQALERHAVLDAAQTEKLFTPYISEGGDSHYAYGWSLADTPLGPMISHNGGGIGGNSNFAAYPERELIIIIASNRIVWRTLFEIIPYEIRLPATEAHEQLAENIAGSDFSRLPKATFLLAPLLEIIAGVVIVVSATGLFLFKFWSSRRGAV